MYEYDERVVMTLDAGGTNFVFSAIRGNKEIVTPVTLPSHSENLDKCLSVLVEGFNHVKSSLDTDPVAISFAFPGPADYKNGIIGDLPNFSSFRGGVALGPFLEEKFSIPVFINNDGNLFAYGEALAGMLPDVNSRLEEGGCRKRYKNILGITLGTGFGGGVVIDNVLLTGDNGVGGDVWILRNKKYPDLIAEESVSIRAVKRVYKELSLENTDDLAPRDIFNIAEGIKAGNQQAAIRSFEELGEMAADAIVHALNIVDGLVVIGGGVAGAFKYILPALLREMNRTVGTFAGSRFPCLQMEIFNLMDDNQYRDFLKEEDLLIDVPFTNKQVAYNRAKRIGIAVSSLGASKAISLGAYSFALSQLDTR